MDDESKEAPRRKRASAYAVLAVLVVVPGGAVAAQVFDGSGGDPDGGSDSPAAVSTPVSGLPSEVTCLDGGGTEEFLYRHPGYRSLDALVTAETGDEPFYALDTAEQTLWLLRPDGTARERLDFSGAGRSWAPGGGERCEAGSEIENAETLAVACEPTSWGYTDPVLHPTLAELAGDRPYLNDRPGRQLYFVGRDGTFSSTTIYSRSDRGWSAERFGKCPGASPEPDREPTVPSDLTCATDLRNSGDIFTDPSSGSPTIEEAVSSLLREDESVAVEPLGGRRANAWILRADGTARLVLHFQHDEQRWWWDTYDSCDRDGPHATPEAGFGDPGLTDRIDCVGQPMVTAVIGNPEATLGWEEPQDAIHWWLMDDRRAETDKTDSDSVIVTLIERTNAVRVAFEVQEVEGHWQAVALAACSDAAPGLPSIGNPAQLVALEVGHCWVEPLAAAGETWAPVAKKQFGSGGLWPGDFRGVGTFTVDGDVLNYLDAGGSAVEMLPTSDPRTDLPGGGLCA